MNEIVVCYFNEIFLITIMLDRCVCVLAIYLFDVLGRY